MTYAYDNWIQLPTKDLYDTQVMAMAINAAKDMYEKGEQRIKDFNTTYGDFITPIQADQDWYNQNVTGKVRDTINNLYARGIDPLRSAEGRAIVAQLVNNIPVGQVAKLRSSAKNAEEYLKNRGKLEAAGLYNPDLEERYLKYNLANWDTINGDKIWTRTSPTEMKTLKELTESWYNNRTPEILNQADVESFNMKYDPRYNYTGFADRHLLDIAAGETPGWRGSLYADYYRDLAERKVAARGIPYTQADVERQLQQDVATANREYKSLKRDADSFALDDYRTANDIKASAAKAAIDFEYDKKRLQDPVFVAASKKSSGSGGKDDKFKPNIFREAEAMVPRESPAHHPWGTKTGMHVGYIPSGQYGELIDPILPASYILSKNKDSGQTIEKYVFRKPTIKDRIYEIDDNGIVSKSRLTNPNNSTQFEFIPDGQIKAARAGNGYRYYISGQIRGNNDSGYANSEHDGSTQVWIEVKERGYVYDGK